MPQDNNVIIVVIPFLFMLILFYAFIIIPERKRKIKYNEMMSSLKIGDEIVTRGGILGRIIEMQEKTIIIESGPDKVKLKIRKNAIASILNELLIDETEK